jgi:hypothetical protein
MDGVFIMQNTLIMFSSLQCSSVDIFQFILPKDMSVFNFVIVFNYVYVRIISGLYVRINSRILHMLLFFKGRRKNSFLGG